MKLYIRQKVFSWKDRFEICDEFGTMRYYAEGEFFSIGKKLHLYDAAGREMSFLHEKLLSFLPRYFVNINGADQAEVVKEFTLLRPEYTINGPGWRVSGDILAHEYQISSGSLPIASVSKHWFTWGDTYEIDISNHDNTILVLSIVLIIDAINAQAAAAASSSH